MQGCGWVCVLVVVRFVFAWNSDAFRKRYSEKKKKNSQTQNKMKNKQKAPQNQNPKRLYIKKSPWFSEYRETFPVIFERRINL